MWPWLRNLEGNGKLIEVFKEAWVKSQMQDAVPMIRVRHYAGSSYIDRMYVTRNLFGIFQPRDVCRSEVKRKGKFGSSHNFHAVFFHDWAVPQKPVNRCYGWGAKQIKRFKSEMKEQFTHCPANVEHGVKWLNNAIVQAFHTVQDCSPNVKAKTPEGMLSTALPGACLGFVLGWWCYLSASAGGGRGGRANHPSDSSPHQRAGVG